MNNTGNQQKVFIFFFFTFCTVISELVLEEHE